MVKRFRYQLSSNAASIVETCETILTFLARRCSDTRRVEFRCVVKPDTRLVNLPVTAGSHVHDSWEMRIPVNGRYVLRTPSRNVTVPSQGLLLITPGVIHVSHYYRPLKVNRRTKCLFLTLEEGMIAVGVQVGMVKASLILTPNQAEIFTSRLLTEPAALMERLAVEEEFPQAIRYRTALLMLFLSSLMEALKVPVEMPSSPSYAAGKEVLRLLQTQYSHPDLSVTTLAKEVGYTPNYLSTLFKEQFNQSIHQVLMDIRLRRAQVLLQDPDRSIKQVAYLTGWSSPLYFSRMYHKRFGHPPSTRRPQKIVEKRILS